MTNIIKNFFETKLVSEILLELTLCKKYTIRQQTQWREVNKTNDFTKKIHMKKVCLQKTQFNIKNLVHKH